MVDSRSKASGELLEQYSLSSVIQELSKPLTDDINIPIVDSIEWSKDHAGLALLVLSSSFHNPSKVNLDDILFTSELISYLVRLLP